MHHVQGRKFHFIIGGREDRAFFKSNFLGGVGGASNILLKNKMKIKHSLPCSLTGEATETNHFSFCKLKICFLFFVLFKIVVSSNDLLEVTNLIFPKFGRFLPGISAHVHVY